MVKDDSFIVVVFKFDHHQPLWTCMSTSSDYSNFWKCIFFSQALLQGMRFCTELCSTHNFVELCKVEVWFQKYLQQEFTGSTGIILSHWN